MRKTTGITEVLSKVQRIMELQYLGLNTPRMVFIPAHEKVDMDKLTMFLNKYDHQGFGNIRTFVRTADKESFNSVHLTHVSYENILKETEALNSSGYNCIVDLETPEHGIYAGAFMLVNDEDRSFIVDYAHKPEGGAMVRMMDDPALAKSHSCNLKKCGTATNHLPEEVHSIIKKAFRSFSRHYNTVILEFCWMKEPCGVNKEHMIFWEYRNLMK